MHWTNLSWAAARELDEDALLPELAALLPEEPHADRPTTIEPASAQAKKARRGRADTEGKAGCISGDS
jgi:hypothetical protein